MTTLEKIRAEIEKEYKWLMRTKCSLNDIDIAFGGIKSAIDKYAEQEKLTIIEANVNGYTQGLKDSSKAEQEPRTWNNHQVACLLADMFDDACACNYNGIDEWLPDLCDFKDTCCPKPVGVACWEQFLKHSRARYCECGYEVR